MVVKQCDGIRHIRKVVIELAAKRKQNVYLNADKRAEIERLFKEGYGMLEIATKVNISYWSLYRELRLMI